MSTPKEIEVLLRPVLQDRDSEVIAEVLAVGCRVVSDAAVLAVFTVVRRGD